MAETRFNTTNIKKGFKKALKIPAQIKKKIEASQEKSRRDKLARATKEFKTTAEQLAETKTKLAKQKELQSAQSLLESEKTALAQSKTALSETKGKTGFIGQIKEKISKFQEEQKKSVEVKRLEEIKKLEEKSKQLKEQKEQREAEAEIIRTKLSLQTETAEQKVALKEQQKELSQLRKESGEETFTEFVGREARELPKTIGTGIKKTGEMIKAMDELETKMVEGANAPMEDLSDTDALAKEMKAGELELRQEEAEVRKEQLSLEQESADLRRETLKLQKESAKIMKL